MRNNMCGIIGYTGYDDAAKHLIRGLSSLEYRGYDSVGIAEEISDPSGKCSFDIRKTDGKIEKLIKILDADKPDFSSCGIGHTRWATNGEPTERNAHPHKAGKTVLAHNGIIENEEALRGITSEYEKGSETDSEVAACLIDKRIRECGDIIDGIFRAVGEMKGSYAFVLMREDAPGKIYAIRHESPLITAKLENGYAFASDITAVMSGTDEFTRLDEGILAVIDKDSLEYYNSKHETVVPKTEKIMWSRDAAEKNGYPHFMLKEIHEEPEVIAKTVRHYLTSDGIPALDKVFGENINSLRIVACGSAMHAGLVGKAVIERTARVPVSVNIASEFRYSDPIIDKNCGYIFVSQSGETADTLAAMRYIRDKGIKTVAVVNVAGSTLAREADCVIHTQAGPEIAVATTKAYMTQCAVMYLIAFHLARINHLMSDKECSVLCRELCEKVPSAVSYAVTNDKTEEIAQKIAESEHLFYIGRGLDCAICTEASLKLKEISYLHSEAYAAGELKHGTISLVENHTPVIAVMTDKNVSEKTKTAVNEVRSRGADVYTVSYYDNADIKLPEINDLFAVFPAMASLQLLAYHTSIARGCDVDQPRNLAKSVTVE